MSKRLLCCSGSLDGGGSERQLWQLASRISRESFAAHVYLIYKRGQFLGDLPSDVSVFAFSDQDGEHEGLGKLLSRFPGGIHWQQVRHLARILERERYDVVYDRTFHMTLISAPACRRTRTPRVSVIVSPPSRDFQRSRERFRWLKYRALRRAYSDKFSVTIAVSQEVADDAAKFYRIDRSRILVVPSPVDTEGVVRLASEYAVTTSDTHEGHFDGLNVVVVGRMSAEKGHAFFLEAVSKFRQEHLGTALHINLVGDGPLRNEVERQVVRLDLESDVTFHGSLSNPYPLMKQASVVCIPSEYEGLPNVALEAMALGTPVIATRASEALVNLLGENQERGELVENGDSKAFADALYRYSQHPNSWRERASAARDYVTQHHDLGPWLQQMSTILERSIALRSRGDSGE